MAILPGTALVFRKKDEVNNPVIREKQDCAAAAAAAADDDDEDDDAVVGEVDANECEFDGADGDGYARECSGDDVDDGDGGCSGNGGGDELVTGDNYLPST